MLREFGFRNYYGFREGMSLSFELDANCPKDVSEGRDYSTIMCVKGANASGKTTVMRALTFLSSFACRSFLAEPDSPISIYSHFGSVDDIEMFANFMVGSVGYEYHLTLNDREVKREALYRTKQKKTLVIERKGNLFSHLTSEFSALQPMRLRGNASLVSTAKQYGLTEIGGVFDFFSKIIGNVSFSGHIYDGNRVAEVAEELYKDSAKRAFVVDFIKSIDVGLTDLTIHEFEEKSSIAPEKSTKRYIPIFEHGGWEQGITWYTESSGTRALVSRLPAFQQVLSKGGVLVADEFDLHLHPHILPHLLKMFTCRESNPNGAQLIFSTHDSDILDLVGKYRIYIVNKRENESFAYRLDEVAGDMVRNDRPVAPVYRSGKLGGIPRI